MEASLERQTSVFPEAWDAPVDDGPVYTFDPMHTPYVVSPLQQSFAREVFDVGFTKGFREVGLPIRAHETRYRNYYQFDRAIFAEPASEDEARRLGAELEAKLQQEVGRLQERWETEHLPRIKELLATFRSLDPERASGVELAALVDGGFELQRELWTIHFRLAPPMLAAMQVFHELYAELFDGADGSDLLAGGPSESVRAGLALGDLAISARDLGLVELFRDTPVEDLPAALERSVPGRAFRREMETFLATYGLFQDLYEFQTPTWREDPSCLLAIVRGYVLSDYDARAHFTAQQAGAAEATERARAALAAFPEAVREQFEGLLAAARFAAFLQEEHNYYIDQQGAASGRLFLVAAGRRLAADGLLAQPDDIFMLSLDEVRALIASPDLAGAMSERVSTRREELRHARTMTPPPFIGPRPPDAPAGPSNPLVRGMGRFFTPSPQQSEAPNQLKGAPASTGVVTGRARVARSLGEATALQPGEVLVAITTMPAWTPLFGIAAAVVTETGGPLSHCAVMAREYRIPAVVGAHGATRTIQSGQIVTVDGGRGVVMIVE